MTAWAAIHLSNNKVGSKVIKYHKSVSSVQETRNASVNKMLFCPPSHSVAINNLLKGNVHKTT